MKNLICELISAVTKYFNNATKLQERDLRHQEETPAQRIGLATEAAPKKRRPYVRGRHIKRVRRAVYAEEPAEAAAESAVKVAVKRSAKKAASGSARKTRKTHGAIPDMITVSGEKLVSRHAFCKLVGLKYSSVNRAAGGQRAFPQGQMVKTPYHRPYAYLTDKWIALATGCKDLRDFERSCRWHRGEDKKAKRIYISEVIKWTGLPAAFTEQAGVTTMWHRVKRAIQDGVLMSYTLKGRRYINADELERWASWWVEHYKFPRRGRRLDFKRADDAYCIHENDLAWLWTGKFDHVVFPEKPVLDKMNELLKLPTVIVNGARYYTKDALKKVKTIEKAA